MILVNEINKNFNNIMRTYNLKCASISENETVLFSKNFVLSFLVFAGELQLVYIEKRSDGELYQYDIDSFVAASISNEDREKVKSKLGIERDIILLSLTLEKKWEGLLSGKTDWIEEYKKFILYIPERNVTAIKKRIYMDMCI